jgi:3,4-dihydroxy 2-butanone 4-phosphate synthase/GTP cyclohydrolase II
MDNSASNISNTEDIIEDARNGKMFILVDHEDRENEGDLIIPGQMATPNAINFMATHGRGLICLALPSEQINKLQIPLMTSTNSSRHETAFTISIEATEGVTTGISAHDRSKTISVAINPQVTSQDIATPGHVFPLRARDGGVLVRAGHTEAAVDISRLAGLNPSGVICEIMNDDGSMARLDDLRGFAKQHNLKIGTISDLISYRRRNDNLIKEIETSSKNSKFGGHWKVTRFRNEIDSSEHIVLQMGNVEVAEPILVRMHKLELYKDLLGMVPDRTDEIGKAMKKIMDLKRGIIVILGASITKKEEAKEQSDILKEYGIGAQILSNLGVRKIKLLSNSKLPKVVGIEGYGLEIISTIGF